MSKKTIGVIGHGFIGQAVVSELIKNTNHKIKILDRNKNLLNVPVSLWHQADFKDKSVITDFIHDSRD